MIPGEQSGELGPSSGQKTAGWIMKLVGLLMFMVAGANFVMIGAVFLAEPHEFSPTNWIPPTVLLVATGLAMLMGGAMRAFGTVMHGQVGIRGQRGLMRWCVAACFRDSLFLVGLFYLLVGISLVFGDKYPETFVAMGLGGLGVAGGLALMRMMNRMLDSEGVGKGGG